MRNRSSAIVMTLYLMFLLIPIYWLINMSLKTNMEITSTFTLIPENLTFANYVTILTDPSWYMGYVNSLIYVVMNTVISVTVALPAAYAFSRYSFMGDKHLFFWLLTNRMSPPAVFALPFFQLYSSVGLFDTHIAVALAHCLFNVPLAVWILEGFMRGVPKEIDETAYIDGYSFGRFFIRIFMPLVASGIGVAAFFCFMFSWVELLLSRTLTSVGHGLGRAGGGGGADDYPRCLGDLLCPQLHRQGLCPGEGLNDRNQLDAPVPFHRGRDGCLSGLPLLGRTAR